VARAAAMIAEAGFKADAEVLASASRPDQQQTAKQASSNEEIAKRLAPWAATLPSSEVVRLLQECAFASAPVLTPEEVVEDPHAIAREDFVTIEHPELGKSFTYVRHPRLQSVTPWRWGHRAPLLGEHNEEIFRELRGSKQKKSE